MIINYEMAPSKEKKLSISVVKRNKISLLRKNKATELVDGLFRHE